MAANALDFVFDVHHFVVFLALLFPLAFMKRQKCAVILLKESALLNGPPG